MVKKIIKKRSIEESLTFDDVLVLPKYSEVLPREVDVSTYLTKKIKINIPIVSAAMDMVTESSLAIAIAQVGGLGIIHKNMSIVGQIEEVKKVKRSENAIIQNPFTLPLTATLKEVTSLMSEKNISGIPIVEKNNKLVGIITGRDIRSENDLSKKVSEIMTKKLITTSEKCSLEQAKKILLKNKIKKLPIINKNGILVGLITYKDIQKEEDNPNACKDERGRLRVGAAIGVGNDVLDNVKALVLAGVDVLVLDSAHGHSKGIIDAIKKIKKTFPKIQLIAGNIATGEGAIALAKAGADAVKVGIGPGSICTTRIISGIGVPQLSAIINTKEALMKAGYEVPIIADGGIRYSGDMVKALVGGASVIMAGSIFAGTEESPGEVVIFEGRKFKNYRGMGSIEAMEKGSKDRYFQDKEEKSSKLVPEGIVGIVPFTGKVSEIVYQYVGGIRSGMGYVGAKKISDLWNATFTKITASGKEENHPHDVIITKEAPNYSK
ncbi:IMP dehydrogenase [Candidatus Nomurabacteria bacterium CG_4_9_14_0_2_um_filter_32_10]|uniref:Inosine-5'-monophosphate dehydrogenase n=3 Tax=Candidatus Nomuraibacteriota TaxID=1752729 RepID=A0A2H0CGP4_9BACT|nr:MAG: IMP dehydrogenase [Candidatus Nomurabacteria bacterium CG22_combo_CG10-13_8_21_14_all_32_8]PIZ85848.1 MAG: IMP dehydrogenase [Candidatus Nomurabacteria bacterium CG_4_10_14_0_2_um_filter_33_9]PJC49171.1 MAG: IMP dehydrogenase [Candidatus Nomurabacteria bacterium CG_4_9_14_0_2_um_filter_32_10]